MYRRNFLIFCIHKKLNNSIWSILIKIFYVPRPLPHITHLKHVQQQFDVEPADAKRFAQRSHKDDDEKQHQEWSDQQRTAKGHSCEQHFVCISILVKFYFLCRIKSLLFGTRN